MHACARPDGEERAAPTAEEAVQPKAVVNKVNQKSRMQTKTRPARKVVSGRKEEDRVRPFPNQGPTPTNRDLLERPHPRRLG